MKSKDWLILGGIVLAALVLMPRKTGAEPVPGMQAVEVGGATDGYGALLTSLFARPTTTPTTTTTQFPFLQPFIDAISPGVGAPALTQQPLIVQLQGLTPAFTGVSQAVKDVRRTAIGIPRAAMARVELLKPRQLFKIGPIRFGAYTLKSKGMTVTPSAKAYGVLMEHGMMEMTHEQRLEYLRKRFPG